jgi:hypothetical protein
VPPLFPLLLHNSHPRRLSASTSSESNRHRNIAVMGIGQYFESKKPSTAPAPPVMEEKPTPPSEFDTMELQPPPSRFTTSSRNSFSNRSSQSNSFLDDIKHEVMVNYLYQQQCSHLWVSDGSGEIEGVLLRKSKNTYMACPPQLGSSPLAAACAGLNVQVSYNQNPQSHQQLLIFSVRHDSKFSGH